MEIGQHTSLSRRQLVQNVGFAAVAAGAFADGAEAEASGQSASIVNVLAIGAKGDGIADDTEFLQQAILTAQQMPLTGVVYLPPGRYRTTRPLNITAPVLIRGDGQSTISGATQIVPDDLNFDVIVATNVNYGVVLEKFDIKAPEYLRGGGVAIRLQGCQHVVIRQVGTHSIWSGVLVDSSGGVSITDMVITFADMQGDGRFGVKCTAASAGNPNACLLVNVGVEQPGPNFMHTADGFVLANGYNSLTCVQCGGLGVNRTFWSTADGGSAPNFFVASGFTADHCNEGVRLDDGYFSQFESGLVTSSFSSNISIGPKMQGPISFANCTIMETRGPAFEILGGHDVLISGTSVVGIGGRGFQISSPNAATNVLLANSQISRTTENAIHITNQFAGRLHFSAITQHDSGQHGLFVENGVAGHLSGSGTFTYNGRFDVDLTGAMNKRNNIKTGTARVVPANPTPANLPGAAINSSGTDCMVYLMGEGIRLVTIDGVTVGRGCGVFFLPAGALIEIEHDGRASWSWQRMT